MKEFLRTIYENTILRIIFKILLSINVIVHYPIAFVVTTILCWILFKKFKVFKFVACVQYLMVKSFLVPTRWVCLEAYYDVFEIKFNKLFEEMI